MDAEEAAIKNREYRIEIAKVVVSIFTPLVLGLLTFVVNNAVQERGSLLKREEQILAEKQKIYAELGRRLNVIFIYVSDVGDFRSYTPPRIVEMKREADRQFFVYQPYWSAETEQKYNEYMRSAFTTYTGAGKPAQINTDSVQKIAAYELDRIQWDPSWDSYFAGKRDPEISKKYYALVGSLLADTVKSDIRRP